jgi:hypothetical protein
VAVKLDHPGLGGEVDAVCFHAYAHSFQLIERGGQLSVLGGDQQVIALLAEDLCQLEADTARGSGDDCETTLLS